MLILASWCNQVFAFKKLNFEGFLRRRHANSERIEYSLKVWNDNFSGDQMWKCNKCNEEFERLNICWGESDGMKVDIIDFFCPHCGNTGYREEPQLVFQGSKEESDKYWRKEWNGEFEREV